LGFGEIEAILNSKLLVALNERPAKPGWFKPPLLILHHIFPILDFLDVLMHRRICANAGSVHDCD